VVDERGNMQTWTHRHGTDGAFAARLKRHTEPA
jgi:16S rRNA C967 or C1407 C5-methylase (RsmB/RsmF family)